ncbi:MAG TPA: alanine--glyoxylate aminotransferase family protein [Planctomycetes bacterium]|nr:alanine--glyoxylate aminotransferase family protein [Planctomycetota bacterium]
MNTAPPTTDPMLWIPGPTKVRPEILSELTRPMIGHRSRAMVELIESLDPGLSLAFGLAPDSGSRVAVGTHSATAMMEGSLYGVGPRVLAIVNGAFSKRWAGIARTLGKDVTVLELPWGEAADETSLTSALGASEPFDAVTLVVNETSTGVWTPLAPIARAMATSPDTMLLCDVVSAIAGGPIDFDAHRIDFALAGVNKALALPPGITVLAASERYLAAARERERRTHYLDPVLLFDGHAARKTPTTPNIGLFRALSRQLADIAAGANLPAGSAPVSPEDGWAKRFETHARMRERTLRWAAERGLAPFPAPALSSPTVSCLAADPQTIDDLLARWKAAGHEVGGGYGPLKGKTFRIGHMGDHTEAELDALFAALD